MHNACVANSEPTIHHDKLGATARMNRQAEHELCECTLKGVRLVTKVDHANNKYTAYEPLRVSWESKKR